MAYTFYIGGVMLPVPPGELQIKTKNQNSTITLINEGEVNIPKKAGLVDINFKVLIPQMKYPFAQYEDGFKKAEFYTEHLRKLKTDQQPFQFIVARALPGSTTKVDLSNEENPFSGDDKSLFGTNYKVLLEEYKITESAANGLDLEVEIYLKEYRDFGTKTIEVKPATAEQPSPEAKITETRPDETAPKAKTHTVVIGDSLWAIAKKYLNNGARFMEIYYLNQAAIDARNKGTKYSKFTIYPGQVFTLP